jgi:hypothetical protein
MYSIQGETTGTGDHIIRIEGTLSVCGDVEAELRGEIVKLKSVASSRSLPADGVTVDLSKLEFISEDCLAMFHRVQESYHIRFKGYSLFVEAQLNDHHLLK